MISLARSFLPLTLTLLAAQEPPSPSGQEPPSPSGQEPPPPTPPPPEPEPEPEPEVDATTVSGTLTWPEERARDARISFSLRSAVEASAAIDRTKGGTALYRSGAWIALGAAGSPADHGEISRQARIGEGLERRAAILALGELPGKETTFLLGLVEDRDLIVAECAMLALLRSRDPQARERIVALAASGAEDARSVLAAKLLEYDQAPDSAIPPRAVRTLVRLRFEAARAFGMTDGANFTASRILELAEDREFVSAVVLRAAVHLAKGVVHDHLLSALLEGKGSGRLAAAVDAIPRQLSQLVENGLWAPRDVAEWTLLLSEIERQRVEIMAPELLGAAEVVPGLRWKARAVASRSERVDLEAFTRVAITDLAVADQIEVCQAIGASEDAAARDILALLDQDKDPRVRSAALVARLRLGDRTSASTVEKVLFDRTDPLHASVLECLGRNAREASISVRLEEYLQRAAGADLATVAAALTAQTQSTGRATARSMLGADAPPVGDSRYQIVRALSRRPTPQDLVILTSLFPQPGETELNIELACSLAVLKAPIVRPILRAALWRGSFDESVLAGFLLAQASGSVRTLIEEIRRPPPGARAADLRRIGFALGEWGGVEALSELSRETGSKAGPEMQGALLGALGSRTQ